MSEAKNWFKKMADSSHTLALNGLNVPYLIKVSTRARRLRITVSTQGVTVTLPKGVPQREAERFLRQNEEWLTVQLQRAAKQSKPSPLPADVILWHGVATQLLRVEEPGRKSRVKVEENQGRLKVTLPAGSKVTTRQAAEAWMRANARQEIETLVASEARRMGTRYAAVSIRDQRTRWGSCSTRGNLSFNWRLVMTPPAVMQYVVVHELAHLFEPNHSVDFWAVVARFFPEFKKARAWLRKNSSVVRAP